MKRIWPFWVIFLGMIALSISIEPQSRLGFAASSAIEPQVFNGPACSGKKKPSPPADTTPPDTTITSYPISPTSQVDAIFEFTCDEGNCTFDCQIDSSGWSPCTSPNNYSGLSNGNHTFEVKAWDKSGNNDPTPASYTWIICLNDCWMPTSVGDNVPSGRYCHSAVWTGTEIIIWGGWDGSAYVNTGGRYNPATDSWTPTSTDTDVPSKREHHSAIWTNSEMIIWGGYDGVVYDFANTGGRYNPATDSWAPTDTGTNVPSKRGIHTAVWTGSQMIIWGGEDNSTYLTDGGRYNPSTDSWATMSDSGAPTERYAYSAVWTGTQMIIWGGAIPASPYYTNTGSRYYPSSNYWTSTSTSTNVPLERSYHSAVWTGTEMIIWGGENNTTNRNTGGRYNPSTNTWQATSTDAAPSARSSHSAIWSGSNMIIWGGTYYSKTGGKYDPSTDTWSSTAITGAPSERRNHSALWAETEMLIWGGNHLDTESGKYIKENTGGIYKP